MFKYLEEYDNKNIEKFKHHKLYGNITYARFNCTCCQKEVDTSSSYSHQGRNLICIVCLGKYSSVMNMPKTDFLWKYVHKEQL